MEQEQQKVKPKKKVLSYIVLAVSVLLLVTATVLTVWFVTQGTQPTLEVPPAGDTGDQNEPSGPAEPDEPNKPSGGEDTVRFVSPIAGATYTVEYNVIYTNETLGWIYRHKAVDFDAAAGTEVCCMADGTVESISFSEETGNLIVVDHGDGLKTTYRFVEPDASLKEGAKIAKGGKLGVVAQAYGIERHDGEHLHLEIKIGDDAVDPTEYLDPVLEEK